jgi:uncharacterized alpha-E superfamily protein
VLFCLDGAARQLEDLTGGRPSRAVRGLGRVTATLKYRDVTELFDDGLVAVLDTVQTGIAEVAEAIADEFFRIHPGGALRAISTR